MERCGLFGEAAGLLKEMIRIPSFSREEEEVSDLLALYLERKGVRFSRRGNNLWMFNREYDPAKKTILLNSHIDTVKPSAGYSRDPYSPDEEDGRLYGLGSNDAGASVVSLLSVFLCFYEAGDLKYNLCLALTAEEECSGAGGIECVIPEIGEVDFAIVGEPTGMDMAIAEKGLMVVDCLSKGVPGHAARNTGENAIYKALKDIEWFRDYRFPKVSPLLGAVTMAVTIINAGTQHNVIPAECRFTVDIRITEQYTHEEILDVISGNTGCEAVPRSTRLRSSSISADHPFVKAGLEAGRRVFGSPTMSDQALIPYPSLKMGPGDSARSHSADEYVLLSEIEEGIGIYIDILEKIIK